MPEGGSAVFKQKKDTLEIFASAPVPKAVLANALPAMVAMLMVFVYNMADTFFVGQTHDALMVAAVTLAVPVFLVYMAFGTAFGIGGTSVISRALGEGRTEYARKVCSFCMWSCVVIGVVVSGLLLLFMEPVLKWIGASAETWDYTREYLTILALGGPFILLANCYSNVVRTEGRAGVAMVGQVAGNLLNVVLDPIMILGLGMSVAGAAWATTISNFLSAAFYIVFLASRRSLLSIRPKDFSCKDKIFTGVMAIGVPATLSNLLMSLSLILANVRVAAFEDDLAVAGYGVAMKMTMITGILCIGFASGVQPLLGYCIGAKNFPRFKKCLRMSVLFGFALSAVMTGLCYALVRPAARAFLTDPSALRYAIWFARVLLSTSCLFGLYYVLTSTLQAMGEAGSALVINLSRQGFLFIPALLILSSLFGLTGLIWAQPLADLLSTILVVFLYLRSIRRLEKRAAEEAAPPQ